MGVPSTTAVRPSRLRRLSLGLGVIAVAVLTVTSATRFAFASPTPDHVAGAKAGIATDPCSSGQLCLYTDRNYLGEVQTFSAQPANACLDLPDQFEADISSVSNKLTADVLLFSGRGCTGNSKPIRFGLSYPDLRRILFDNQASSVRFLAPPGPCDPRSRNLCLYADPDMTGEVQIEAMRPAGTCVDLRPSLKGKISSAVNNLMKPDGQPGAQYQPVLLYATDGCAGDPTTACFLDSGVGYPNMTAQDFDNVTRSVKFLDLK
jgi:hypothetical protein